MQEIKFYVSAASTLGVIRDYANAKNTPAPTMVRGCEVMLKMRLFANSDGDTPYPIDKLKDVISWQWVMDKDYNSETSYILEADNSSILVQSVTEEIDELERTFTEVAIPITKMNTVQLTDWLGTEKGKSGLYSELIGFDANGQEIFVLQLENFTIRNRITSLGDPDELDPEYLTAEQVHAVVRGAVIAEMKNPLEYQFSVDGATNWHSTQTSEDKFIRNRIANIDADWSNAILLPAGQSGGESGGTSAGFGTPTASATQLEAGSQPTVSVTATGEDTAKVFDFQFGIPKGDKGDKGNDGAAAGFGNVTASATSGTEAKVTVTTSGSNTAKNINFDFVIPKGEDETDSEGSSTAEYTAFEVYAHNTEIPVGESAELGGYVSEAIPANMTHMMILRTSAATSALCDAVIDWGDGAVSKVADGDYNTSGLVYGEAKSYTVQHTYASTGKYIVKVYGKTVYNIQHREDVSGGSDNYNLMCRCFAADLPIAVWMSNSSNFCRNAKRLLKINVSTVNTPVFDNAGGLCRGCINLLESRGFNRIFQRANCESMFLDCRNMTYTDACVPMLSYYQTACTSMFENCSKLAVQIYNLFPYHWSGAISVYFNRVFYNCSSLLGTSAPDGRLWNNSAINWKDTTDAFTGCPDALRANTPESWGGKMYDSKICPTGVNSYATTSKVEFANNKYFKVSGAVTSISARISENIKNSYCIFTTGYSITWSFNIDAGFKINKAFDFLPNTTYIVGIDNKVILWSALVDF